MADQRLTNVGRQHLGGTQGGGAGKQLGRALHVALWYYPQQAGLQSLKPVVRARSTNVATAAAGKAHEASLKEALDPVLRPRMSSPAAHLQQRV